MTDYAEWNRIQERARKAILFNFTDTNCLAAAAPTGFGKTRLGANLLSGLVARGYSWIWYTHRKTLLAQTVAAFESHGLVFGVRASGHGDREDVTRSGQVAMIQSEKSAITKGRRELHDAKFVVVDEAHANKTGFADELLERHLTDGAKVLLLTATPVGLTRAERLIILANLSEMRSIGALLKAVPYTVPTQDMTKVKKVASGDFSPKYQAVHFTQQQVVGNILLHYHRLQAKHFGADGSPCLGFAPCVKSSISLTQQFCAAGVTSAHIDGDDVYLGEHDVDGNPIIYNSDQKMRQFVFDEFEAGRIKVIWNRFVMREGVDLPSIGHVICATSVGTPETWVQMIGRGLRCHDSLTEIVLQDHGGNCNRPALGGPNQDRAWELEDTNASLVKQAKSDRKEDKEDLPKSCPNQKCGRIFLESKWQQNGWKCPACGRTSKRQVVTLIEADGQLVKFYPKSSVAKKRPEWEAGWTQLYYRMRNSKDAFRDPTYHQMAAIWKQQYPGFEICKETGRVRNQQTQEVFELYNCPKKESLWGLGVKQVLNDQLKWRPKG